MTAATTETRLHVPDAETAARLLADHFLTRRDIVAWNASWNACPTRVNGNLDALLTAHLLGSAAPAVDVDWTNKEGKPISARGHFRMGTYSPGLDGKTIFGCVDCDGGGRHGNPLADPLDVALQIMERLEQLGLAPLLEKSGSGTGWHVWLLFAERVAAAKVRRLLFGVVPADAALADGGKADAGANVGLEVFPKQDAIDPDGQGNLVWLPWWCGAKDGGNLFYHLDGGELVPYLPNLEGTG